MTSQGKPFGGRSREGKSAGKTVLVIGVFDLFHRGHVELLRKASAFGDRLVVIINGDEFTARYKRRPIYSEQDRLEIVKSTRYVDEAVVSNSADAKPFIEAFDVKVIVHGDDWNHESYLKQICVDEHYLEQRSVELAYTDYYPSESTSKIIGRIAAGS